MKFSKLSSTTKFKLIGGQILLTIGVYYVFTGRSQGILAVFAGNLLFLDGRISKMEEENESKSNSVD